MAQQTLSPTQPTVSITPSSQSDGIAYAVAVPITSTEADLNGGTGVQVVGPFGTTFGEAICATVQISANGYIVSNSTYVVMQMDMGDGVWVDMAWCFWNGNQGTATFVLSNGVAGANAFQQSRQPGQVPVASGGGQGNGSNQMALGGRIRFVGKSTLAGGSSSISGTVNQVTATIRYRLQSLR